MSRAEQLAQQHLQSHLAPRVGYPLEMWEERFSQPGYAYGKEPNDFLVEALKAHVSEPGGRALCLAEGEGRNAVYAATRGYQTLAVDQSSAGLAKAAELAEARGVALVCQRCDLNDFAFPAAEFALVVSIYGHVPAELRRKVHRGVVATLRPGGIFVLEAYHPDNIGRGTGGPQREDMCMTAASLREELAGLEFLHLEELEREVNEGNCHHGLAAVTQVAARKPA